jgi:Na+/melibiose symporter-like transporter
VLISGRGAGGHNISSQSDAVEIGGDSASRSAHLSAGAKILFGTGAIGEAVYLGLFNGFITIYYNQAIGLSNALIGTAIMLAMIGDAITDPLLGIVSDRWRSRHGRRHPFLFAAPIPMALSLYFIFNPPDSFAAAAHEGSQWMLFGWLCVWTIASRAFNTLYAVPHLALGGELSKDQHHRSQLFSANTVIGYVSGASFAFIAWSYFFAGERIRASDGQLVPGHLDAAAYGPLVLAACALILVSIWFCAAGTYRHVARLSTAETDLQRLTLVRFLREILSTMKNRNYIIILVGYFFFMIASGIYDTLNVFINTYFWELVPEQIRWLGLIAAPAAMLGALLSPVLMRRFDRKPVMLAALAGTTLFAQLVVNLRLLGWFPENGDPLLLPLLLANAAGFTFTLGVGTVAIMSMLGDIVDENELTTGKRQEGLFYSARAFFAKASYSFGHFFAGITLDLFVRLPFEAVPGKLSDDILFRLGITAGPIMGLAALFSLAIYSRYRLSRARHQEILDTLENRRLGVEVQEPLRDVRTQNS